MKERGFLGAFEYYLQRRVKPSPVPLEFFVLSPPLDREFRPKHTAALRGFPTNIPQSLELWHDGRSLKFVAGVASRGSLNLLDQPYGRLRRREFRESYPAWADKTKRFFAFDVELNHALTYTGFAEDYEILDRVSACIVEPAWLQFVFAEYDWAAHAETCAIALDKYTMWAQRMAARLKPEDFVDTFSVHAPEIAKMMIQKAHAAPTICHIRGLLPETCDSMMSSLQAVLESIEVAYDNPVVRYYPDYVSQVGKWMIARDIPDPEYFLSIHENLFVTLADKHVWSEWGEGRELVPVFCLSRAEVPFFATPPSAVARRRRGRLGEVKSSEAGKLLCPECSKELPSGATFCPFCGTKLRIG